MGFGFLLVGYFVINVMAALAPVAVVMPLGYLLIALACRELTPYESRFRQVLAVTLFGIPFAVYFAVIGASTLLDFPLPGFFSGAAYTAIQWVYVAYSDAFHLSLLFTVSKMTGELGLIDLKRISLRNLLVYSIYVLLYCVISLPVPLFVTYRALLLLSVTILRLIAVLLNVWLFFRCYRLILPEGSDALPARPVKQKKERK